MVNTVLALSSPTLKLARTVIRGVE